MKCVTLLFVLLFSASLAEGQWVKQVVDTTANLRGLSVVSERVIWASGTGGTVIRTTNGGKIWKVIIVPGGEKLDFRDIEAFDANTAYILSIGNGDSSRIYKTIDGGKTWKLQFKNTNEKAFYDAIACWDKNNCIAMSDPVNNKYLLIGTKDGGATWILFDTTKMPVAKDGEAAFAASGTCLITRGKNNAFLVTGGNDARVFRSNDRGKTWQVAATPMVKGTGGSGIFSIAMFDEKSGVIVGGDYEKPIEHLQNYSATTADGGKSWGLQTPLTFKSNGNIDFIEDIQLSGYRSGVAYLDKNITIAVGTNGSDISRNGGKTWRTLDEADYNAIQTRGKRAVWAVGPNGMVAKLTIK